MAKTDAPLLSFGASGAIAKAQVYGKWRGISYARRYVAPSNPQSTEQTKTRSAFKYLNQVWKFAPAALIAPWDAYATGQKFLGRNAFIGQNTAVLRAETDLLNFIGSPGAKGGIPASALVLTPGNDQIQAVLTAPTLPTGWTITEAAFVFIPNANPQNDPPTLYQSVSATDASSPYDVTKTGLLSAQEYIVSAWFKYLKADGNIAYGPAISDNATTT